MELEFESLKGKKIIDILLGGVSIRKEPYNRILSYRSLSFITDDLQVYTLYHEQDCGENVELEDIAGDLDDLIDSEILVEEAVSEKGYKEYSDSTTWTFYKINTRKGYVTLRWCGTSNGYYSEEVDLKVETLADYLTYFDYGVIVSVEDKLLYINFDYDSIDEIYDVITGEEYDYIEDMEVVGIEDTHYPIKLDDYRQLEVSGMKVLQFSSKYPY